MIVLNSLTKRDVTTDYLKLMAGEITRKEFAEIAGIKDIKKYLVPIIKGKVKEYPQYIW